MAGNVLAQLFEGGQWVLAAAGVVIVFLILMAAFAKRYIKVGPNEVLVISGLKHAVRGRDGHMSTVGFRIRKGGGAFVVPILEKAEVLSLEIMTLEIKTPEVYTVTGVPVIVDGVAQIKVKGDDVSIATAAEQFLSKSQSQIMQIAMETVQGHLRAILGTMTVEDIYKNREAFSQRVQEVAAGDLANMGLTIVSFTLRDIRDNQGYLDALGKPRTAQVKRDAIVGQAEADRDATIRSAQAYQAGQEAKFAADAKIAEAQRDYEVKKADYQASINLKRAEADLAYDLQKYKTGQAVKVEEIQVEVVAKQKQAEVQEQEILRKEKELEATVKRPADAERYRIQALASAEQFRIQAEATGQAEAKKQLGVGEAEAQKAKGLAEAEVIRAQGASTAEAMAKKAQAWQAYNEAAILQLLIDRLPDIASAIAAPLAKTDRITIVSTGGGDGGAGASKVTKDVIDVIAQLPPAIQALSGVDLAELVKRIPELRRSGEGRAGKGA
jgi:flotillin